MPPWLSQLLPIVLLLGAVAIVVSRLPRVDLGYTSAFRRRRVLNWLPLGLTYSFLYMGRYNLNAATTALEAHVSNKDFGDIFFWGTLVYGCSFVLNGPLTDKLGGRTAILISAVGSALCNLAMGAVLDLGWTDDLVRTYSLLYAANMYFQSFGAVSIVKVNAYWFHVRERGTFGGIFGILISLGIYFAFDWSRTIIGWTGGAQWAFYVPAAVLLLFVVLDWFFVFDLPSQTGHPDVETGDAQLAADGERLTVVQIARRLLTHPVLVTIALVEFCSGFFRQAVMQWGPKFAKQTGVADQFVHENWGLMLCLAGILGGMVAGTVSDHVFQSRRGPSAAMFYGLMLLLSLACTALLDSPLLGWCLVLMSMCIIGVHGLLSATASMDFAGRRNTGLVVGIVDGFVYLGTALQAILIGHLFPDQSDPGYKAFVADWHNWKPWPLLIVPAAAVGFLLSLRLWNARPRPGAGH